MLCSSSTTSSSAMISVSTASISSDSAEPSSYDAGADAVSVACSDAFITAWSVQCSGKSDGAGSGGGTANCAVGAVAVFPGSDSESSEEQEGWQEYADAEEVALEVALEEMVLLAFN